MPGLLEIRPELHRRTGDGGEVLRLFLSHPPGLSVWADSHGNAPLTLALRRVTLVRETEPYWIFERSAMLLNRAPRGELCYRPHVADDYDATHALLVPEAPHELLLEMDVIDPDVGAELLAPRPASLHALSPLGGLRLRIELDLGEQEFVVEYALASVPLVVDQLVRHQPAAAAAVLRPDPTPPQPPLIPADSVRWLAGARPLDAFYEIHRWVVPEPSQTLFVCFAVPPLDLREAARAASLRPRVHEAWLLRDGAPVAKFHQGAVIMERDLAAKQLTFRAFEAGDWTAEGSLLVPDQPQLLMLGLELNDPALTQALAPAGFAADGVQRPHGRFAVRMRLVLAGQPCLVDLPLDAARVVISPAWEEQQAPLIEQLEQPREG